MRLLHKLRPPDKWRLPVIIAAGVFFGLGIYSFYLSNAYAYLGNKSETCVNCHILPLGFVMITMIMAQFMGLVGLGPYFPWAIPGLNIVPAGTPGMQLVTASWIILALTGLTGFFGTISWFNKADQY